jgi:hypothetical protein
MRKSLGLMLVHRDAVRRELAGDAVVAAKLALGASQAHREAIPRETGEEAYRTWANFP